MNCMQIDGRWGAVERGGVNIAVVDAGGNLKAFRRMDDGAWEAGAKRLL